MIFTRECTNYILSSANELAQLYSSTIPLIQGENARFKVAKLAAAIAARTFSTEDGNFLLVKKEHAKLAVTYLQRFFNKPSMGYREFSQVDINTKTLTDIHLLDEFFTMWPNHMKKLIIDGLLSVSKFGVREMQDWCNTDGNIAKKHIGTLVRCQAIQQQAHGLYIKRPEFIKYLKKMKKGLSK